jgi:hypothetical protein
VQHAQEVRGREIPGAASTAPTRPVAAHSTRATLHGRGIQTPQRRDISQAEQYRDDLISRLQPIDVMVLGKEFDARIFANMPANVTLAS